MSSIVLRHVTKYFAGKIAVRDLDLEIKDGEFVIVVGPSGCGKTTTLRMLAGFERPSIGTIEIGGKVVNNVSPKDRNLAMVFQSYALFPHMDVANNLAFGMRIRRESKSSIERNVEEISEMLGIHALLGRKPAELSGGERQRVALGRALLRKPQAFLLDEPLSNLDAALRAQMRLELKRIHSRFPVTKVYVTHDQVEAMTMADRVVLLHQGELQQVGPPNDLYSAPVNSFVAGFIGAPKINLLPASLVRDAGSTRISFLSMSIDVAQTSTPGVAARTADDLLVGFRPEDVGPAGRSGGRLPRVRGVVEVVEPLGSETHVAVRVAGELLLCRFPARTDATVGAPIELEFDIEQMKIFDRFTGMNLHQGGRTPAPTYMPSEVVSTAPA
jgi:multiple sugar transport system ATP-binding protein